MVRPIASVRWLASVSALALALTLTLSLLPAAAEAQLLCWGDLSQCLHTQAKSHGCPSVPPTWKKTYDIQCTDPCGHITSQTPLVVTGYGGCGVDEAGCGNPFVHIVCWPVEGITVFGYNPPTVYYNMINKEARWGSHCGNWFCTTLGSSTYGATCPCGAGSPAECGGQDPILINPVDDTSYPLTAVAGGVRFDIDGDHVRDPVAWTAAGADVAFLVLDRNGNGTIDSGRELFGDVTPQLGSREPNGFRALALFDGRYNGGDGDGAIGPGDRIYADLQLWTDRNHDGASQAGELATLAAAGVERIELTYTTSAREDRHGNRFRYRGRMVLADGGVRVIWDVFLTE